MSRYSPKTFGLMLALVSVFGVISCSKDASKRAKHDPILETIKPAQMAIPEQLFFSANTQAYQTVSIVARTRGFIADICFTDGQVVKKGDLLYRIEQVINRAETEQAQAQVQVARAEVSETAIELRRYTRLVKSRAASQDALDQARLNYQQALGDLKNAKAVLTRYKQDLIYTDIRAPFDGRMSKTRYYPGQLVGASNSDADTLLSTINQLSPLYVYFEIPSTHLQRVLKAQEPPAAPSEVEFTTIGRNPIFETGHVDFIDTGVKPAAGTITARAVIPNKQWQVYPGQSGHLILTLGKARDGLLLPSLTIKLDQLGSYVYRLNGKGSVERVIVERKNTFGPWTEVSGIKADDQIITNYLDSIKPGQVHKHEMTTVTPGPKPNSLFDTAANMSTLPAGEKTPEHVQTQSAPMMMSAACKEG